MVNTSKLPPKVFQPNETFSQRQSSVGNLSSASGNVDLLKTNSLVTVAWITLQIGESGTTFQLLQGGSPLTLAITTTSDNQVIRLPGCFLPNNSKLAISLSQETSLSFEVVWYNQLLPDKICCAFFFSVAGGGGTVPSEIVGSGGAKVSVDLDVPGGFYLQDDGPTVQVAGSGGNFGVAVNGSISFEAGGNSVVIDSVAGTSINGPASLSATPTFGDNSTKIATTAFVADEFAPLASPALTGDPTAPTQTAGDSSTNIATTEYADNSAANAVAAIPQSEYIEIDANGTGIDIAVFGDVNVYLNYLAAAGDNNNLPDGLVQGQLCTISGNGELVSTLFPWNITFSGALGGESYSSLSLGNPTNPPGTIGYSIRLMWTVNGWNVINLIGGTGS